MSGHAWAQPLQEPRELGRDRANPPKDDLKQLTACVNVSARELKARRKLLTQKLNSARTLVEAELKARPTSADRPVLAALVLAQIYESAEGNLPKALFWTRTARRWLTKACGARPKPAALRQIHQESLLLEPELLGKMDRRDEQLATLERYEELYKTPQDEYKIWPLVKLGRYKEAKQIGLALIQSEKSYVRSYAFNGLMALECERRNREASYDWGLKGHHDAKERSCVIALNMGLASRQTFKFEEEERFNRIALKAKLKDCSSSPYIQSATTYLIRGEFQKSISALTSWAPKTPLEWSQSHMRVKARRAELMFGLGVWRRGLKEIYQVVTYPDRSAGTDSASEEMLNLEAYLLYWALLDGERVQLEERHAARGLLEQLKRLPERIAHRWRQWRVKRQVIRFATHHNNLIDMIRPYLSNAPAWYSSTLTHLIGSGVLRSALKQARALEVDHTQVAHAYLDGFEAELAWVEGDAAGALDLAERALKYIPKASRLFRYRITAIRWAARTETSGALRLDDDLHTLLKRYPPPLRLLNLGIPVRLIVSVGVRARAVADALKRSPRFVIDAEASLSLRVDETADQLKLCLIGARGDRYRCVSTWVDLERELKELRARRQRKRGSAHDIQRTHKADGAASDEDSSPDAGELSEAVEPDPALRLVDRAHRELFSPLVELSQKEMDTLDGNIQQISAEDALNSLF